MRALIQRVSEAAVRVDGDVIGATGPGLLILICAMEGDTPDAPDRMAAKIAKLRIFKDDTGKMNRSLLDTGGSALIVSQFTLAGDTSRGNRPGFSTAARPDAGRAAYLRFIDAVQALGIPTATGTFGADMAVSLTNDGPVTLWIDL
ncbi:D-tyrosyl-tRNA(Tyr) deacylase [Loktanella sp. 3ANDIMAR09]|uniref:D-aminoacyl-tRNA deacylase n=1 Tax=Loktanella sp. 3ANDIMAR09 TaxID=1225657 RepID=UPI0006F74D84|nr:D-aminoacyl-tRNA deacylase [Loktanella sp. 3ANDIMAR09]KQI67370.1 D-tyrosyl-tRNA(Tyr) deacylase [Loktanella sp. 3ANDIMAR09]